MSTTEQLLTAEEFANLPDLDGPCELVRGQIVMMNQPVMRHGEVGKNIAFLLELHVRRAQFGRVITNDSGAITGRDPDTVRGADVAFYSFNRVPRGPTPTRYTDATPELAFEVLSPIERWTKVLEKITDYLQADVLIVCVVDPQTEAVHIYQNEAPPRQFTAADEFTFPDWLGNWRVKFAEFFHEGGS